MPREQPGAEATRSTYCAQSKRLLTSTRSHPSSHPLTTSRRAPGGENLIQEKSPCWAHPHEQSSSGTKCVFTFPCLPALLRRIFRERLLGVSPSPGPPVSSIPEGLPQTLGFPDCSLSPAWSSDGGSFKVPQALDPSDSSQSVHCANKSLSPIVQPHCADRMPPSDSVILETSVVDCWNNSSVEALTPM